MSPVQTEAQASPSFSLLLFTPYPSPPRACNIRSGRCGSTATNAGYRNACRMQHSYEFEDSLQHVLFECQPSSCFFTVSCGRIDFVRLRIRVVKNRLWSRELRLTIPWQILNVLVRWGDHRVGSNAFPSPSTARFGGVTVVLAGKTFLGETVLAQIRSKETYALAVASSGIAALLLPKGSTAHSRFKIPIDIFDDSTCNVPKQEQLAELWDEALMQHHRCFGTLHVESSKMSRLITSTTWCSTCCRVTLKPSTARIWTPSLRWMSPQSPIALRPLPEDQLHPMDLPPVNAAISRRSQGQQRLRIDESSVEP
ncbi:BQ5605_C011g06312 [Microbotryum silenes-dioicae]|uniref:ATP-dependent DNA helicase n=1 Tax=Microbotryum silenes-dioicae TaxID=796604 RepID=A0A2X0LSY8_9BASI|nr:BQ5605_C011g06312 [Microbotryum silenes-dioicae]